MRWTITGPLASLDVESTSVDVEDARVVDIALALIVPGRELDLRTCLVDPGVPIPPDSTAVHGITDERVQAEGKPAPEVLDLYVGDVALALKAGIALVAQNATYDLSVLHFECLRHGLPTLEDRLGGPITPVVDPMVLDKRLIKYRKRVSAEQGARQLKTLAQVYGVPWDDSQAHGAAYDALVAARVVWRMGQWCGRTRNDLMAMRLGPFDPPKPMHRDDAAAFLALATMTPAELHAAQIEWARAQNEDFAMWLRGEADKRRTDARKDEATDEERAIAHQDADELDAKADGVRTCWPLQIIKEGVSA